MTHERVWCVGGLDTSGGAGVTRDLITLADLDVHGCVISTQVAVQTNSAVLCTQPTTASNVNEQWQALASEGLPDAIKIGAIANDAQAQLLCARLKALPTPRPFVVWDPVLTSSSGGTLSQLSDQSVSTLVSTVDLITPNTDELNVLSGQTIDSDSRLQHALHTLLSLGAHAILAKGGHAHWQPKVTDTLLTAQTMLTLSQPRTYGGALRGTGCMLASALCAFMVKGYAIDDALTLANGYLQQVRVKSLAKPQEAMAETRPALAKTAGFPRTPHCFPSVSFGTEDTLTNASGQGFAPLSNPDLGIYPVVDDIAWLKKLLPTGVNIIQLRLKQGSHDDIAEQIKQAVALTKHSHCQLFINDHWQLAIEHGAYGVHLGQEDLAKADLNAILQAGLRLGISTHGYAEIQRIKRLAPSYIALGHIFPTTTKTMPSLPQGIERLACYVALCEDIPTVAIGGINVARAKAVASTGVSSIAVVTAITQAANPINAYYNLVKEAGFAH